MLKAFCFEGGERGDPVVFCGTLQGRLLHLSSSLTPDSPQKLFTNNDPPITNANTSNARFTTRLPRAIARCAPR